MSWNWNLERIMASQVWTIKDLLEVLKKLPRKPQETPQGDWTTCISTAMNLKYLYWINDEDFKEIQDWMDEENVCVAWDWRYWIDSEDMEFTTLLTKKLKDD